MNVFSERESGAGTFKYWCGTNVEPSVTMESEQPNQLLYDPTSPPTIEPQFQHHLRILSQDKYCCPNNPSTRHIVNLLFNDTSKEEHYEKQIRRFLKRTESRCKIPNPQGRKTTAK